MNATRRLVALASIAVLATTVLAACGSSSDSASSSASSSEAPTSEAPSPSDTTLVGGDPSTWTPVEVTVDMNDTRQRLVEGQFVVFTDLPKGTKKKPITIVAKNDGIVDITQPTDTSNGGFQAASVGKTSVTVWKGKPGAKGSTVVLKIRVTVKPYDPNAAIAASPSSS